MTGNGNSMNWLKIAWKNLCNQVNLFSVCFGPFETTVRSAIRIPAIVRTDKSNCIQRIVKLAANLTHARSHLRIFVSISFCGSLFKFTSIGILSLGLLKRIVRVNTETS